MQPITRSVSLISSGDMSILSLVRTRLDDTNISESRGFHDSMTIRSWRTVKRRCKRPMERKTGSKSLSMKSCENKERVKKI